MVDIAALCLTLLFVVLVFIRKSSAGVAVLALLAGVMIDQLLAEWIIGVVPDGPLQSSSYFAVAVHILLTFAPVIITIVSIKTSRRSTILTLLTSLVLGFMATVFGIKIAAKIPQFTEATKNSGLLHFLDPYLNVIIAGTTILALVELIISHRHKGDKDKKKKK